MSEYSTSTATSEEQGGVSGDGRSESGTADDHSVSDASSRSERGDLSPESTTHDPGGNDHPSVGTGQRSADDGSAIGDGGMSAWNSQRGEDSRTSVPGGQEPQRAMTGPATAERGASERSSEPQRAGGESRPTD